MIGINLSPSILKGYIAISSFLVNIQGLISLFLGMNHMIIFNTDSSWIYDYFDIQDIKINLTLYGFLLLVVGTSGMIGIFKKKNNMVFVYNVGILIMFIYSLALLIPVAADQYKELPACSKNKNVSNLEEQSVFMQSLGLCTVSCPCSLKDNMKQLYNPEVLKNFVFDPIGKTSAIECAQKDQQNEISNSRNYKSMARLENYYNCQGMCTLYAVDVYQFTNINRGPPYKSTCYSQLVNELDYFYMKSTSALSTQIVQFVISLILAYFQYKIHPKSHNNKNMGIYARLGQL